MREGFGRFFETILGNPDDKAKKKKKKGLNVLDLSENSEAAEEQKQAFKKEGYENKVQEHNNNLVQANVGADISGNPEYRWMSRDKALKMGAKINEAQSEAERVAQQEAARPKPLPKPRAKAQPTPPQWYSNPPAAMANRAAGDIPVPITEQVPQASLEQSVSHVGGEAPPQLADVIVEQPENQTSDSVPQTTTTPRRTRSYPQPAAPEPTYAKKEKERVVIADTSQIVEAMAMRQAREKVEELRSELKNSGFLHKTLGRGFLRFAENSYLIDFYKEAKKSMLENRNLMAEVEAKLLGKKKTTTRSIASDQEHRSYMLLDSVIEEFQKELVEANEKGNVIQNNNLTHAFGDLFAQHAMGRFASRADFEAAAHAAIKREGLAADEFINSGTGRNTKEAAGLMYATNLWHMAERYKNEVDEKVRAVGPDREREVRSFINGTLNIDIMLGAKQRDMYNNKPESVLKFYDKAVNFTQSFGTKIPGGKLISSVVANPFFFGVAATMATRGGLRKAGMIATTVALGPAATALVAGGIMGGAFSAARRSRDLKYDRAMDLNRKTLGAESGGARTDEMRKFSYELMSAEDATARLIQMKDSQNLSQSDKDFLAEVIARIQTEREKGVDLMSVRAQEGQNYKTKYRQMVDLKGALVDVKASFKDLLEFSSSALPQNHPDADLIALVEQHKQNLVDVMQKKDKEFDAFKRKEMLKSGLSGALGGVAAGAVAQFGWDAISTRFDFSGNHAIGRNGDAWIPASWQGKSFIRGLGEWMHNPTAHYGGSVIDQHGSLPWMHSSFKLPDSLHLVDQSSGGRHMFDIVDAHNNVIANDVIVGPDGKIPASILTDLQTKGIPIHEIAGVGGAGGTPDINALKGFHPGLDKHARADWHDEVGKFWSSIHKKMIEFEGKQQMLYVEKDSSGIVHINAKAMMSNVAENIRTRLADPNFGLNPDGTIDSKLVDLKTQLQGWINSGELEKHVQLAIIPTEEANKKGLSWLLEGSSGGDVALPKDLSDQFTTPQSLQYLHHPFKYMEVRVDGHVLATTIGKDMQLTSGGTPGYELNPFSTPHAPHEIEPSVPIIYNRRKELEGKKYPPEEPHLPGQEQSRDFYGYYNEKPKSYYTNLYGYRNNSEQLQYLRSKIESNDLLNNKYAFVLKRLKQLQNFNTLPENEQKVFKDELERYNKRFFGDDQNRYLKMDQYVDQQIMRIYRQLENIVLHECGVGEKPYNNEFYENSPLIRGIKKAEEIVIVLDAPLGDAVLMIPTIDALKKYCESNGIKKPIKVVTTQPNLFKSLEEQYNGWVTLVPLKDMDQTFASERNKQRFVINTHKSWEDYELLGISEADAHDPSKVMSVDYGSWIKEEIPQREGFIEKYDPIPARVMRNFEVMVGQKLYDDINSMDHFLEKTGNFDQKSKELREKYGIQESEQVVIISPGSSVTPKEYSPDRWAEVILGIEKDYPNARILVLDDPSPAKRERYGQMVSGLLSQKPDLKICRVNEGLSDMNVLMSMADCVITPDTGLGHYAGALGKPNILLSLGDAVQWSTAKTIRVMHPKAVETYRFQRSTYSRAWDIDRKDDYYVEDEGRMVGASDIPPQAVLDRVHEVLGSRSERSTAASAETQPSSPERGIEDARQTFTRNPFVFVYNNMLGQAAGERGMSEQDFVRSVFESAGKANVYDQVRNATRGSNGRSAEQNMLYQLTGLLAIDNPSLLSEWKAANPEGYEGWVREATYSEIRPKLENNSLTRGDIETLASQFNIESEKLAESTLERVGQLSAANDVYEQVRASGITDAAREDVLFNVLKRFQDRRKRGKSEIPPVEEARRRAGNRGQQAAAA